MGLNVRKRVADLQLQIDESHAARWRLRAATIVCFLALIPLALVLPSSDVALRHWQILQAHESEESDKPTPIKWTTIQTELALERVNWLGESILVLFPWSDEIYRSLAHSLIESIRVRETRNKEVVDEFSVEGYILGVRKFLVAITLRGAFVVIAFWPLWLIALMVGWTAARVKRLKIPFPNILSVLDRKRSPFYSGIYGPLRPNGSFSGTDLSCPGLACPPEKARKVTLAHPLASLLKRYGAMNETNLRLLQIILAHGDYPSAVGDEIPVQAPEESDEAPKELEDRKSDTGFVAVENSYTLEKCCNEGLTAILEAHARISRYRTSLEQKQVKATSLNRNYPAHLENLRKLLSNASELCKTLTLLLSPNRMWALGQLPPTVVATTYLAIEAGKCLVFRKHGERFTRISNYPHLQARAIVHSVPEYHQEYKGDMRLIIRQAIICSRRHGDFARAFLPNRMPVESRALRDWLEVLYAEPRQRNVTANIVELDAHIEEIGVNWRLGITNAVRKEEKSSTAQNHDKGIPHKSVVLLPLERTIELALRGFHEQRRARITELLQLTSKQQAHFSISARLPGFKRQAMEAQRAGENSDDIIQHLTTNNPKAELLLEQWTIVRRMLTRYNWLSTRVGDDGVPIAGLVLGVLATGDAPHIQYSSLGELVPLRQRRYVELFGKKWESLFFKYAPNMEDVAVFVTHLAYSEALQDTADSRKGNTAEGRSDGKNPTRAVG